jgi:hypothetical protein
LAIIIPCGIAIILVPLWILLCVRIGLCSHDYSEHSLQSISPNKLFNFCNYILHVNHASPSFFCSVCYVAAVQL